MVDLVIRHNVRWLAPSPTWIAEGGSDAPTANGDIHRPVILRFADDNFMEELTELLQVYPYRLGEWIARPETWSDPMPQPAARALLKINEPIARSELQRRQKLSRAGRLPADVRRAKAASQSSVPPSAAEDRPLKLYQPAHQRFYLVATSLVCRRLGLPDRTVDTGKQEQTGFVIRRRVHTDPENDHRVFDAEHADHYIEYAFVMTPAGGAWRNITEDPVYDGNDLIPGEERLPLFAMNFPVEDGRRRRVLAGLVPVGKREAYMAAPPAAAAAGETAAGDGPEGAPDIRMVMFESRIGAPWRSLLEQAVDQNARLDPEKVRNPFGDDKPSGRVDAEREKVIAAAREQILTVSWYVLLDLAKFLKRYLPNVRTLVHDAGLTAAFDDPTAAQRVFNALLETRITADGGTDRRLREALSADLGLASPDIRDSLRTALQAVEDLGLKAFENTLESLEEPFEMTGAAAGRWPSFYFPLADPGYPASIRLPGNVSGFDLDAALAAVDALSAAVAAALPEEERVADPGTLPTEDRRLDPREGWFQVRCVYERPNCGPYHPPIVSQASAPFQMAAFFDPDAPARPIRIPLPVDVSPAGLRKFKKGAAFELSDMLCGHLKRIRKFTLGDLVLSVLPWPFHKDLPGVEKGPCKDAGGNFGMLCSLSIPIVTLCALILLIVIVSLFDIIFRWMPYLMTCFRLPGFEAKKK